MLGAQYVGQLEPASVADYTTVTVRTGGGGWSYRGAVALPKKRPSLLPSLPKLPKPPYAFYCEERE